jgi:hypothetical protein
VAESGKYKGDHIREYLNSPNRHTLLTENKEAASILYEHGVRGIRHQAGGPQIASEVFAFISPQNMRAKPINFKNKANSKQSNILGNKRNTTDPFGENYVGKPGIRAKSVAQIKDILRKTNSGARGILNNFSPASLSRFGNKLPPGMRALVDDMTMIHRSDSAKLKTLHPRDVRVTTGNMMGPGTYFYKTRGISKELGERYGENLYRPKHNLFSAIKTATSKGYLDHVDGTFNKGIFVDGRKYDSEVIQDLLKQGYIGLKNESGIRTNLLTGTKFGPRLKPAGQKPGLLEQIASMFNTSKYFANGGMVKPQYFANGGMVKGYAQGGDVVPSMLTPGEFVLRRAAVDKIGLDNLNALNSGTAFSSPRSFSESNFGVDATNITTISSPQTQTVNSSSVYNYNLSVNVASMSDPNTIAQTVMGQIRQIDSQRLRGNRF